MKPDINLKNPFIKDAINFVQNKMAKALSIEQKVESAVIPIYHIPDSKIKPIQIGSGVIVKIKNEYFIFSASHVFDDIGDRQLLIGDGLGLIQSVLGDRFSSPRRKSGNHSDDPIDASVYHILSPISQELKKVALTLNYFDFSDNQEDSPFIAAGFRMRKSNTAGSIASSKREGFPTLEISKEDYNVKKIERDIHIGLVYEDQILIDGSWKTSPTPKGFSGGAVVRIEGMTLKIGSEDRRKPKQLLTGIIIEQRRGKGMEVLIGARIHVHLQMIVHFLPNLTNEINRFIKFK